jgi:hypothetical protein
MYDLPDLPIKDCGFLYSYVSSLRSRSSSCVHNLPISGSYDSYPHWRPRKLIEPIPNQGGFRIRLGCIY